MVDQNLFLGQARWLTSVIPTIQEAEIRGQPGQELVRLHLINNQTWYLTPVIPGTREAQVGGQWFESNTDKVSV
jgi:hypothetical protein